MAERSLKLLPEMHPAQERQAWELMRDQASILVKTGFLPESIKTPEQAMAVMMKGRELHVPPMYALSNIVIVKGKPSCSAELMLALVRRDHGPDAIRVKETTNERCTVEWRQRGWDGTQTYSFTIADAKQAQLVVPGGNWAKYPAAMLRARCLSAVARMAFPESIAGMYTPGELGDEVTVTDDGEVMSSGIAAQVVPTIGWTDSIATTVDVRASRNLDTETGEIIDVESRAMEPPADDRPRARSGVPPTERQLKMVHAVAKEKGMNHDDIHALAIERYQGGVSELDRAQVSALIDAIQGGAIATQQAPTPIRQEAPPEAPADDWTSWTSFWKFARENGIDSGPKFTEITQRSLQTMAPEDARQLLVDTFATMPK